jgi:hypothetical protein
MNLDKLHDKLIAAARASEPSNLVPQGFERRIQNRIRALGVVDNWADWAKALWRAAAPCVGVALVLAAWFMLSAPGSASNSDVSQDFENTVLAGANLDPGPADSPR